MRPETRNYVTEAEIRAQMKRRSDLFNLVREGQMWPFFSEKSGLFFISQKYRESPLGVAKRTEIWSLPSRKTAIPQKRTTWSPPALQVVVDLQPWGLQMAIFSYLLQHKECPNFSNQTTIFLENRPDLSLPTY